MVLQVERRFGSGRQVKSRGEVVGVSYSLELYRSQARGRPQCSVSETLGSMTSRENVRGGAGETMRISNLRGGTC